MVIWIWRVKDVVYAKYLDEFYLEELYQNHDIDYLNNMDQDKFLDIYNLFLKYNFNFMEDIILKYLDIFGMDCKLVEKKLNKLIKILGPDYVNIIGDNISYLEYIVRD